MNRMTFNENPGCTQTIGGFVFFFSATLAVGMYFIKDKPVSPFTIGAMVAGFVLITFRKGVTIDLSRGIVRKWWGFLVPFRFLDFPLASFESVIIKQKKIQSMRVKGGGFLFYSVILNNGHGNQDEDITIFESTDLDKAREKATQASSFLGTSVRDSAT